MDDDDDDDDGAGLLLLDASSFFSIFNNISDGIPPAGIRNTRNISAVIFPAGRAEKADGYVHNWRM